MSVIFVRHADLKYPYNNYDRLSLNKLDLLATEKIQPTINYRLARSKIKQHLADGFLAQKGVDAIYHSPTPRAKQTAELLAAALNVKQVKEYECLKEIAFSPKKLITPAEFQHQGMDGVRKAVYKAVEQGNADETTTELIARINTVKQLAVTNADSNIVVVTHGFFMRLLQIALLQNKLIFKVRDQEQAVNYDYLQGFEYKQGVNDD